MKRLICWIRGHRLNHVIFMGWFFAECARCGKVSRGTFSGSGTTNLIPLPKELVKKFRADGESFEGPS